MSFAFNFSDSEEDSPKSVPQIEPVKPQTTTSQQPLATSIGEFDPIAQDLFKVSSKISDTVAYTDVSHGLYEGGLKVWESSDDLLDFLATNHSKIDFVGKRVIELGAGHGHPGIWCLSRGTAVTCLQDLNEDALAVATAPNVLRVCGAVPLLKSHIEAESSIPDASIQEQLIDLVTNYHTAPGAEEQEATLATPSLELLHRLAVKNAKYSTSSPILADAAAYEHIKALVISGQEDDPVMVNWVLEVETEIATTFKTIDISSKQQSTPSDSTPSTTKSAGTTKNAKNKKQNNKNNKKTTTITAQASNDDDDEKKIMLVEHSGFDFPTCPLQPHSTFIYGPWGTYGLEQCMLRSSRYELFSDKKATQPIHLPYTLSDSDLSLVSQLVSQVLDQFQTATQTQQPTPQLSGSLSFTSSPSSLSISFQPISSSSTQPTTETELTQQLSALSIQNEPQTDFSFNASLTISPQHIQINNAQITPTISQQFLSSEQTTEMKHVYQLLAAFAYLFNKAWSSTLFQHTTRPIEDSSSPSDVVQEPTRFHTTLDIAVQPYLVAPALTAEAGFTVTSWTTSNPNTSQQEDVIVHLSSIFVTAHDNSSTPTLPSSNSDTPSSPDSTSQLDSIDISSPLSLTPECYSTLSKQHLGSLTSFGSHSLDSPYRFDIILSAETLYSLETMPIFLDTLRTTLARHGKAFIAAKRFYFGVGGATSEFCNLVRQRGDMKIETLHEVRNGSSNIREILLLTWDQDAIKNIL